jgi:anti-sigma factor RsiW
MNCDEAEILLHSVVDNEIDVEPARHIEAHVAACPHCAAQLRLHLAMRGMISNVDLRFSAPPGLRTRIKTMLPVAAAGAPYRHTLSKGFASESALSAAAAGAQYRRTLLKGFAFRSALSAAAAGAQYRRTLLKGFAFR